MFRQIAIPALLGALLAGCATAPSDLDAGDMRSAAVAPAPPPAPPVQTEEEADITAGDDEVSASSGFQYAAIGSAFAGTRPDTPYSMNALGAAPYWRASLEFYELSGELFADLHMVMAENDPVLTRLRPGPDHLMNGFRRFVSAGDEDVRVSASFQAGPCRGADGIERPFFASIQVNNAVYSGCAREDGGQWDWSRDILTRFDEVRMCLDEVTDAAGAIDAYSPSEDHTAVRVITADQRRFECMIVNAEQRLTSLRELDATEVHLNEGRTVFLPEVPEANECQAVEHIRGPDGELMGALVHDLCQNPRLHVEGPLERGES
ncbi:hypothetical protein [Hyphobacterium sp.]|uniref:hypothetical protein n=1 Tax=Hyphobacterium sp. TaxID=2004662 RepID=UPI00374834DE